jgi:hypothetical protein
MLKKGEYLKIRVLQPKKNKSIYSFLSIKIGQEYAFIKDLQSMSITVYMLKKLEKYTLIKTCFSYEIGLDDL